MQHIDVIIASPGHSMMSVYVHSLLRLIEVFNAKGIKWAWSSEYSSHVGDARELTLNGDNQNDYQEQRPFKGKVTYDKILWIDSDIVFTPDDAMKLIESDKDIITGAYLLGSGEVTVYPKFLRGGLTYNDVLEMKEPMKVEGCGFGFVAVKSGVFPMMGEDLSWCKRVIDNGYEIWFDPSVRVTHNKMMKLTWEGIRP